MAPVASIVSPSARFLPSATRSGSKSYLEPIAAQTTSPFGAFLGAEHDDTIENEAGSGDIPERSSRRRRRSWSQSDLFRGVRTSTKRSIAESPELGSNRSPTMVESKNSAAGKAHHHLRTYTDPRLHHRGSTTRHAQSTTLITYSEPRYFEEYR